MPKQPKEITFSGDSPLTIEWEEWKPETAVQGSMMTLKVISNTAYEYLDYYSGEACTIFAKVYRRGWDSPGDYQLVWAGSLDPDFYEEPYERASGYEVSLSFSDFGGLARLDFSGDPFQTYGLVPLRALLNYSIGLGGIGDGRFRIETRTAFYDSGKNRHDAGTLGQISIAVSNFIDEDGSACTWRDMVEGILLPLGLHAVQRAGTVLVYDTEWIRQFLDLGADNPGDVPWVNWTSDTQTLGAAERAGKVSVDFSPYSRSCLLPPEVEMDRQGETRSLNKLFLSAVTRPGSKFNGHPLSWWKSFTMSRSSAGKSEMTPNRALEMPFFSISPIRGNASACDGFFFPAAPEWLGHGVPTSFPRTLLEGWSRYIPEKCHGSWKALYLKLSMELLWDMRINPFEEAVPDVAQLSNLMESRPGRTDEDEKNARYAWEEFRNTTEWVAVPLRITLRDEMGQPLYYFSNIEQFNRILDMYSDPKATVGYSGSWKPVTAEYLESTVPQCYAQWYGWEKGKPAVAGWTRNKATIGVYAWPSDMSGLGALKNMPDGMVMAWPPVSGQITVEVLDGIRTITPALLTKRDNGTWTLGASQLVTPVTSGDDELLPFLRWRMMRNIKLEIIGQDGNAVEGEDQTAEATVSGSGREEIQVSTVCGAVRSPDASMLGLFRLGAENRPMWCLEKGRVRNYPDRMLANSILSQYSVRRHVLSGEASETVSQLIPIRADFNCPKEFIISASKLDAINGTEELTLTQLMPESIDDSGLYATEGGSGTTAGKDSFNPEPPAGDPYADDSYPGDSWEDDWERDDSEREDPEPDPWGGSDPWGHDREDDGDWDDGRDGDRDDDDYPVYDV